MATLTWGNWHRIKTFVYKAPQVVTSLIHLDRGLKDRAGRPIMSCGLKAGENYVTRELELEDAATHPDLNMCPKCLWVATRAAGLITDPPVPKGRLGRIRKRLAAEPFYAGSRATVVYRDGQVVVHRPASRGSARVLVVTLANRLVATLGLDPAQVTSRVRKGRKNNRARIWVEVIISKDVEL